MSEPSLNDAISELRQAAAQCAPTWTKDAKRAGPIIALIGKLRNLVSDDDWTEPNAVEDALQAAGDLVAGAMDLDDVLIGRGVPDTRFGLLASSATPMRDRGLLPPDTEAEIQSLAHTYRSAQAPLSASLVARLLGAAAQLVRVASLHPVMRQR